MVPGLGSEKWGLSESRAVPNASGAGRPPAGVGIFRWWERGKCEIFFRRMEKVIIKRNLAEFRERENPWKNKPHAERLSAMLVICGTHEQDGKVEPGFSRVHRIARK